MVLIDTYALHTYSFPIKFHILKLNNLIMNTCYEFRIILAGVRDQNEAYNDILAFRELAVHGKECYYADAIEQ